MLNILTFARYLCVKSPPLLVTTLPILSHLMFLVHSKTLFGPKLTGAFFECHRSVVIELFAVWIEHFCLTSWLENTPESNRSLTGARSHPCYFIVNRWKFRRFGAGSLKPHYRLPKFHFRLTFLIFLAGPDAQPFCESPSENLPAVRAQKCGGTGDQILAFNS